MQQEETPKPNEESIFTEADYSMEGYDKPIRRARTMLFIIAGLQLVILAFMAGGNDESNWITIAIGVFVALVFVILGIWTRKKPFAALLIALIFYIALMAGDGILDPMSLFRGIIFKIAVIVLLILGLRNAKEAIDLRKSFGK